MHTWMFINFIGILGKLKINVKHSILWDNMNIFARKFFEVLVGLLFIYRHTMQSLRNRQKFNGLFQKCA